MQKYDVVKVLNSGSFGTAILVRCKSDGALRVIKDIDISKLPKKERETTLQEVRILEALRHPNIVAFEEAFIHDGSLKIVMQYCDGGDLLGLVKSQNGKSLDEGYILDIFVQLSLAIKHVHDRKIIHRDIKTENIFLSSHRRIVKLGDFGIAKVLENTLQQARTSIGTPYYLSPEICQGKLYNFKSDIWSLGVVLYELCALRCPFAGANMKGLMLSISKGSYQPIPACFSLDMRKLISDMLNLNPKSRPSINDLLRRPILQLRITKFIEGSVYRQEFCHTVLHGQHFSQSKCQNPVVSPRPFEAINFSPASLLEAKKLVAKPPSKLCLVNVKNVAECVDKGAGLRKPLADQDRPDRGRLIENIISEKIEKEKCNKDVARIIFEQRELVGAEKREKIEKAAEIAEKVVRDKRDKEIARMVSVKKEHDAKLDREKRDREIARQRELHAIKQSERQAELDHAAAFVFQRANEDREKQKRQQALALEAFRNKHAKQWLGGIIQPSPHDNVSALGALNDQIGVPNSNHIRDIDVAKRLWSPKSPALNLVDQVKARGAAQKIEEQKKYEQALAIARKEAFQERLVAESRRQREFQLIIDANPRYIEKVNHIDSSQDDKITLPEHPSLSVRTISQQHSEIPQSCSNAESEKAHELLSCLNFPLMKNVANSFCEAIPHEFQNRCSSPTVFESLQPVQSDTTDDQEEESMREIVGELLHLTADPASNLKYDGSSDHSDADDCITTPSIFEQIENLRLELECELGTQNFINLYQLAISCQDGSSERLESEIDSCCGRNSDSVFNGLVQLLNFESQVYNS